MGKFNYRHYRSRLDLETVDKLPEGVWKSVADAARYLGVDVSTVRRRYLKDGLPAVKYRKKVYVKIYKAL